MFTAKDGRKQRGQKYSLSVCKLNMDTSVKKYINIYFSKSKSTNSTPDSSKSKNIKVVKCAEVKSKNDIFCH